MSGLRCSPARRQLDIIGTQEGQSLAELALLLPLLLLIMAVTLDLGRAFYAHTTVVNAAREGARYAALHPTDTLGIRDQINQEAANSNIDLSSSTVDIEAPEILPGSPITVTVIYDFQPILGQILGSSSFPIRGSVVMVQF